MKTTIKVEKEGELKTLVAKGRMKIVYGMISVDSLERQAKCKHSSMVE